ncbi:hypothetical protein M1523_01705 [Patescibacteria group bacterium]|nr:hypothetical protein [Patescibacteria group bacterium]
MQVIDLSQPLYDNMKVYPGDPEVHIKQAHWLDKDGWRLPFWTINLPNLHQSSVIL